MRHIGRIVLLISFLVPPPSVSQVVAPYAGEFLSLGAGARSLALGGAYSVLSRDATAGYWNPSALLHVRQTELMLMHEERFGGLLNYDVASVALPWDASASAGVTILRLGIDGIPDTRDALVDLNGNGELDPGERLDESRVRSFSAADWAIYGSYAWAAWDRVSVGVSVKLIRRSIADHSATGVGFDAGVTYEPWESVLVGATLQDATTTLIAWSTGRTELIAPTLRLGAAAHAHLGDVRLTPAVEVAVRAEGRSFSSAASVGPFSFDPAAGIEAAYRDVVMLRAGWTETGHATLGTGISLQRLDIDYAFAGFAQTSDLGTSHRISLALRIP